MELASGRNALFCDQRKEHVQVLIEKCARMALLRSVRKEFDEDMFTQPWRAPKP